jgi:hypothetical protein
MRMHRASSKASVASAQAVLQRPAVKHQLGVVQSLGGVPNGCMGES